MTDPDAETELLDLLVETASLLRDLARQRRAERERQPQQRSGVLAGARRIKSLPVDSARSQFSAPSVW